MTADVQGVDREKIRTWLKLQYGTDKGTAWISVGPGRNAPTTFSDNPFQWPEQAEEAVDFIVAQNEAGFNVWYAAHLSYSHEKKKADGTGGRAMNMSVKRRRLHVDIDRALTAEDTTKLRDLDAWVVYSGSPGHVHAYIELNHSVDVGTYHRLEDQLVAHFDSDRAVCRDNGLLRIPGTVNQMSAKKTHPTAPVTWDESVGKTRWNPKDLVEALPAVEVKPEVEVSTDPIVPVAPQRMPEVVRNALNASSADRSSKTATIVNACKASDLSLEETLHCLQLDAGQVERYRQKGSAFKYKEVRKLYGTADEYNPQLKDKAADDILGISGKVMGENQAGAFEDPQTPTTALPSSWAEVSMDRIWDADYRMQETTMLFRDDDIGLLYPGKSHDFHGPSGSGKSWIAKIACAEQVRAGNRVLYLDYESDNESLASTSGSLV